MPVDVARSTRPEVRNPLLGLPAAQDFAEALAAAPPEVRQAFKRLLGELKVQCREKEVESYRKRKGPQVQYWMSTGTWVKHLRALVPLKGARR